MSMSSVSFPKAVLFDFDGIVVDTERLHYEAFQAVLKGEGLSYSWATYEKEYMGFDDRDAFAHTFNQSDRVLSDELLQHMISQKASVFIDIASRGSLPPYPGLIELIDLFVAQGVKLGLCSGALRSDIEPILARLSLREHFLVLVTAEDVAKSKPHPESYAKAWQALAEKTGMLQTPTAEVWAIEDTPEGLRSARGAGLMGVGIAHTHGLEALGEADLCKANFSELILWLNDHVEAL